MFYVEENCHNIPISLHFIWFIFHMCCDELSCVFSEAATCWREGISSQINLLVLCRLSSLVILADHF